MRYIMAIDQGTTSTRAILFDPRGGIQGISQKELKLYYPRNGWVEQVPDDIWADTQHVCRAVLKEANAGPADVIAIGITNQRETTVVWDRKTGKALYNAIVWQDRRTAEFCAKLKSEGHAPKVTARTGLLLDPYFSATKLLWILENVEGAREKAKRGELAFGTIDSFLLWRMTDGKTHATDITNASRTLIFDIVKQQWDDDLLKLFDIPPSMLPEVHDNSAAFGMTHKDFLGAEVPVTGMAGDQQAALVGQACFHAGSAKITYGTGCFALVNIGDHFRASKNKMLTTVAYRLHGKISYAVEGAIFSAGSAVQWLRDGLGIIKTAAETEALAASVENNGGVYLVPAFTGLGAPHWNPDARGALTGLTRDATSAHIARAALEAQGYQTKDLLQAMVDDGGYAVDDIRVDGGLVKNNWVCQFIADMTGASVVRPVITETTALGAAYLAGLQVGVFASTDDIAGCWQGEKTFTAAMDNGLRRQLYAGWQHAIRQVLAS